jgi:hypothetical protein
VVCSDPRIEDGPGDLIALYLEECPSSVTFDGRNRSFERCHRPTVERNQPDAGFLSIGKPDASYLFHDAF